MNTPLTQPVNVFGLGRVGLITTFMLASQGYKVSAIDIDEEKLRLFENQVDPYGEPQFVDLLTKYRDQIQFTSEPQNNAVNFICVPTPFDEKANAYSLKQLYRVMDFCDSEGNKVILRSTVHVGTCQSLQARFSGVDIIFMPEFHRAGHFVDEWRSHGQIILGGVPEQVRWVAKNIFRNHEIEAVNWQEAEILKQSCNMYHAMKVTFANEVGRLASHYQADAKTVMRLFCDDTELNISTRYFRPGYAFGGPCLKKDLLALKTETRLRLPEAVLASNQAQIQFVVEQIRSSGEKRIGILGAAFKENCNETRGSAVVDLVGQLTREGVEVFVCENDFVAAGARLVPFAELLERVNLIVLGAHQLDSLDYDQLAEYRGTILDLTIQQASTRLSKLENYRTIYTTQV